MTAATVWSHQARLKDLLVTTKDGDWGKSEPTPGHLAYRVIRGTDFARAREGDLSSVPLRYLSETTVWRRTLEPYDILIETAGGTSERPTGRTVLVTPEILGGLGMPTSCASFARFLRVDATLADPAYIFWYLQDLYQRDGMRRHEVRHTGVGRFQYTKFAETESIPLPPKKDQRGIAATLGAFDDKIMSNRRAMRLIETLGAALLDEVVNLDVYGFPEYDPGLHVGDIVSILETGSRPKGGASADGVGVISLGAESVQSAGVITTERFKTVPEEYAESMRRGRLENEDILVYKDGGKPGNFVPHISAFGYGFPVDQAMINEHVYRARAIDGVSQGLLYWLLRSPWMDQEMRKRGTGVAIPGLNSTNFRSLPIPALPRETIEQLNDKLSPMLAALLRYGAENRRLAAFRETLLPELVSGRIQVPEAAVVVKEIVA